jgi:membrane protease YdiL (CAAX protease family)
VTVDERALPRDRMLRPSLAIGLWGAMSLLPAFYLPWQADGARASAFVLAAFAILLAGVLWLAAPALRERWLRVGLARGGVLVALWPLVAYLVFALGAERLSLAPLLVAAVYALIPILLLGSARGARPGAWQDYVAMVLVLLPIKAGWLEPLFPHAPFGTHYTFNLLYTINVGLAAFLFVRRMEGVGYSIGWHGEWAGLIALAFVVIALIDVPGGLALRFMEFHPGAIRWYDPPLSLLGIFIFTAWPEEFLFRGLLQNSLQRSLRNPTAGWIAAAVIFGLSHIAIGGFPNWRYVILAIVAGLGYGLVWRKTGSIFPGAIVHALVDATWHLLFRTT